MMSFGICGRKALGNVTLGNDASGSVSSLSSVGELRMRVAVYCVIPACKDHSILYVVPSDATAPLYAIG